MSAMGSLINFGERVSLPDGITLAGIAYLVGRTRRRLATPSPRGETAFARHMSDYPIAVHTDDANAQHYEVPARFFELVLGPRRKYSCCLYETGVDTLSEAEERALAVTARNAGLENGQHILELGCGWGSLSLWMAEHFPDSQIFSVSNSRSQRAYIESEIAKRGLHNLEIVTADMNDFATDRRFDRIVSVEMFEHMSNWRELLTRAKNWLHPEGSLFLHVFSHKAASYRFDHQNDADWIARHFFTGGIMPSHGLIREFGDLFILEQEWRWNGTHYARTAFDWLANFDRHQKEVGDILISVYGADAELWRRRWRLFFLATAGLFGHAGGEEWGVSHYRLKPTA
jgi:cyclopropane-fatty-acyl-phospholipid synthase